MRHAFLQNTPIPMAFKITSIVLIGLTVLGVVFIFTLGQRLDTQMRKQATDRQESNMAVAWQILRHQGEKFYVENNMMYAGNTALNNNFEIVDKVQNLVGGVATLFMGDVRVSTNVKRDDGGRAIGTKLALGPVHDRIFIDRKPYRGEADILGHRYATAYDPIFNTAGDVIGVLFVGIKLDDYLDFVHTTINDIGAITVVAALAIGGSLFWFIRFLFAPLRRLIGAIRRIAQDELDINIPAQDSRDEIGEIARAVVTLKEHGLYQVPMTTTHRPTF
ncbi:membrane hypothetical protein [Azospirillaceae bacterium]